MLFVKKLLNNPKFWQILHLQSFPFPKFVQSKQYFRVSFFKKSFVEYLFFITFAFFATYIGRNAPIYSTFDRTILLLLFPLQKTNVIFRFMNFVHIERLLFQKCVCFLLAVSFLLYSMVQKIAFSSQIASKKTPQRRPAIKQVSRTMFALTGK